MTALPAAFTAKTKPSDCILWTGALNSRGYGCFAVNGKSQLAHRLAYEAEKGSIPEGLTIDHLCRVKHCVNPDHLEPVTVAENNRRARQKLEVGSPCLGGHILTEATLRVTARGTECRECLREQKAARVGQEPNQHGLAGYKVNGCRCDVCREAQRGHNAAYRAKQLMERAA